MRTGCAGMGIMEGGHGCSFLPFCRPLCVVIRLPLCFCGSGLERPLLMCRARASSKEGSCVCSGSPCARQRGRISCMYNIEFSHLFHNSLGLPSLPVLRPRCCSSTPLLRPVHGLHVVCLPVCLSACLPVPIKLPFQPPKGRTSRTRICRMGRLRSTRR